MNPFRLSRKYILLAFIISFLLTAATPALEWEGKCVKIHDGDTISVMYHELPLKVRLYGIDAPERGQDFSRRARQKRKAQNIPASGAGDAPIRRVKREPGRENQTIQER